MVVCNASNHEKMRAHFAKAAEGHCDFEDRTDQTALFALQGPKAMEILARAETDAALMDLSPFRLARGKVLGKETIVARTGYTGEDGFEIFCDAGDSP